MSPHARKKIILSLVLLSVLSLVGCEAKERDELTGKWTGDWYFQGKVVLRGDTIEFQPGKNFKLKTRLLEDTDIPVVNRSSFLGSYSINLDEYPHEIDITFEKICLVWFPLRIPEVSTSGIFKLDRREEGLVTLHLNPGIKEGRRPMPDTLSIEKGPVFLATRPTDKAGAEEEEKGWLWKLFLP